MVGPFLPSANATLRTPVKKNRTCFGQYYAVQFCLKQALLLVSELCNTMLPILHVFMFTWCCAVIVCLNAVIQNKLTIFGNEYDILTCRISVHNAYLYSHTDLTKPYPTVLTG